MKITRILASRIALPLHGAACKSSCGKSVTGFDSTKVMTEADICEA